jgi:hypothetical protein
MSRAGKAVGKNGAREGDTGDRSFLRGTVRKNQTPDKN